MKVAVFSSHEFEKDYLVKACAEKHELQFFEPRLTPDTVKLTKGFDAVALFVNDNGHAEVLEALHKEGVKYIALRSAGYNHVDLTKAKELNMKVANVPAYSPYAIAEHTLALILALNRKMIKAHNRVIDLNFSLDGLVGFDLNGKTVGVVGLGNIGSKVVKILHGFGCKILAYDLEKDERLIEKFDVTYANMDKIFSESDIITLHVPLTPDTKYMVNADSIKKMKRGVMLINTSRGGLVDTKAVIDALKTRQIGYLGLDVYEEEQGLFFEDHSDEDILQDDVIGRLLTFKNVIITSHQAFLTREALTNIADTTAHNLNCFESGNSCENLL